MLYPILKEIKSLGIKHNKCKVILCGGEDAWILPFFDIKGIEIIPIPIRSLDINSINKVKANYLLMLDNTPFLSHSEKVTLTTKFEGIGGFWGRSSYLYTIK